MHEAQMHEKNSFITLTYADQHLPGEKLKYKDFQAFQKKLRTRLFQKELDRWFPNLAQKDQRRLYRSLSPASRENFRVPTEISIFVTGEYGDQNKRPHWHAIIFNWRPDDCVLERTTERGDQVFSSETLGPRSAEQVDDGKDRLWNFGKCELGSVTFESAGYCARYAAKKLTHGHDGTHEFEPISRKSAKNAIGKTFIEKFHDDVFNSGFCLVESKEKKVKCGIPRYYEKWLQKHEPEKWVRYVTQKKLKITQEATAKEEIKKQENFDINEQRRTLMGLDFVPQVTEQEARKKILEQKFQQLQERLKL